MMTRKTTRAWFVFFLSSPQPKREEVDGYNEQDVDEAPGPQPTDPNESRQFSQVISGLQKSYPTDKMEEISTSFCFICLLHLANEQGLKLESDAEKVPQDTIIPDDDEDEGMDGEVPEGDKKIGNIWDIKVGYLRSSFNFRS